MTSLCWIGTMEYLKEGELEYKRERFNVSSYADFKMQTTALGFRLLPKKTSKLHANCSVCYSLIFLPSPNIPHPIHRLFGTPVLSV